MNALKNKVQLIGRLGAKPEVRELESGKKMARLAWPPAKITGMQKVKK